MKEINDLLCAIAFSLPLDAGVDVFAVLSEDDHVHVLWGLHGRWRPVVPANRAHASVEVEFLSKGDVEGADAPTNGGRERTFDGDKAGFHGVERCLWQPFAGGVEGFLTRQHFRPNDAFLATVGFLDGRVDDVDHHGGDVHANAVAFDVVNDGVVRNVERSVFHGYRCTSHVARFAPQASPSRINRPWLVHAGARGVDRRDNDGRHQRC